MYFRNNRRNRLNDIDGESKLRKTNSTEWNGNKEMNVWHKDVW